MATLALWALWALAGSSAAAGKLEALAPITAPLAPAPALSQLRIDLLALKAPVPGAGLPPSALGLQPAAWANLGQLLGPAAAAQPAASSDAPAAGLTAARTDALERLGLAQQILGRFQPEQFQKLPPAEREAVLSELWEGWRGRGLTAGSAAGLAAADPQAPIDALILEGVRDKELTSASKSIFLGVAVLGYTLEDSLWLTRTRLYDALDENRLRYPRGQRWKTSDNTPEFLGISDRAQGLLDAWGNAADYAKQIIRQTRAGSMKLPANPAVAPAAAASFARLAEELLAAKDHEALDYLSNEDPTFAAFLLDARKPGYFLYNGDKSIVGRIIRTKAFQSLGARRVDHPDESLPISATYLYRPSRVLERLKTVSAEPLPDSERERKRLASYIERLETLVSKPSPAPKTAPYSFIAAELLPGSALQTPSNKLSSYPQAAVATRYDLPLSLGALRAALASGKRHSSFDEAHWSALKTLFKACPALREAPAEAQLRLVSQRHQTSDLLVFPLAQDGRSGVLLQVVVLDEIARLEKRDRKRLASFLSFLAAATEGALRS